ncbi:MAG TPA: DNA topoisomerase (ATP-hydrolyzing) subunit B [Methanosarcinales archaeon]|nr:DNA topoisomerase (ATP-hydrolyzing) subunit B [Methanosarcinales archaeon]
MKMDKVYTANNIQVLEGLEAVRKRPSMYIGSTDLSGLHHLAYEVIDNCIDEAVVGYCNNIEVYINPDNSITVQDNGRGIPVDLHEEYNRPAVEIVLTMLHAGGKFDTNTYKVSGGLHGVGISVVNALSEWLEVEIRRDNKIYFQRYENGIPIKELTIIGNTKNTGTKITFKPDKNIFESVVFNFDILYNRLRELAFLNKGVRIYIKDRRSGNEKENTEEEFKYDGGLVSFVQYLNENKNTLHEPIFFEKERDDITIGIAMQYTDGYTENILAFANNINTKEGGTHLSGFKSALTRSVNDYAIKNNFIKNNFKLNGEDIRDGLTAVISIFLKNPQFEGQTKTKLGNSEVKGIVESIVKESLNDFFEENPKISEKIINKALIAARAREAAKKSRELVRNAQKVAISSLPGKLADCSSKNKNITELYIVEGDSAGGSAKQGRDRRFQAILPLRGKIINVEKARLHKIYENNEIQAIITASGTGIGEDFDIDKIRYGKIIIMTDADVDGAHIRTLLLTFFYRYMTPLIESGYIYIAQPPLYRIKKGKNEFYVYSEEELKKWLKEIGKNGANVQRYKGLGEMNPDQLWKTTMNPENRTLLKVTMESAVEADKIFTILMGDKVEPRREFIHKHAKEVQNLDV